MINPIYGTDVLLNAALWVAERLPEQDRRIHKLFKILWFADLEHLKQYGRSITGDTYVAMNYGPVPSALYDMVKGNCSPELRVFTKYENGFFDISRKCDADYLSETDVKFLQKSMDDNASLSFQGLVQKSHAFAWNSAWKEGENTSIRMSEILDEIDADAEIREIVKNERETLSALSVKDD